VTAVTVRDHYAAIVGADREIRIAYRVPRSVPWQYRVRQVLWGMIRVQLREPRPQLFLINAHGVPRYLFDASTKDEAQSKFERLQSELATTDIETFLARYRVPLEFIDQTEWPKRMPGRLEPLI
jgi:hypothetical protein